VGDDAEGSLSVRDPKIRRRRDGTFALDIPPDQRELLRGLPAQLRELLSDGDAQTDPALRRLFPPADLDDAEHAAEFDRLVREDLLAERSAAIDTMERTIDADRVSEDELVAWLGALNDLRLVLGTRLDVTEETAPQDFPEDDPRAQAYALYAYLSFLEEQIVEALSG
jgi:uncharacterized protein DUF2017